MKKVIAIVVSLLFVLAVAGLSFAAEKKKTAAKVMQITGPVMQIDLKTNKTFAVADKRNFPVYFTTNDKTTVTIGNDVMSVDRNSLLDILELNRVGKQVTVTYSVADDGQKVANSIVAVAVPAKEGATPAEKKAEPAKKEGKKAIAKGTIIKVMQVIGEVAAVDAAAKTITVKKGHKKDDVVITVDDKTLADVKAGDRVTADYTADYTGKYTAKSVKKRK